MKKIFLNETEKQRIISEKEKAIMESFAKTYNKIKRVDESDLTSSLEKGIMSGLKSSVKEMGGEVLADLNPENSNNYRVEVIGALPYKDGGYKYRWVYGILAYSPEEAEIKAEKEFKKMHKYDDISFFSAKTIENPTEDDMTFKPGERIN